MLPLVSPDGILYSLLERRAKKLGPRRRIDRVNINYASTDSGLFRPRH
jgi:hypothetical protein